MSEQSDLQRLEHLVEEGTLMQEAKEEQRRVDEERAAAKRAEEVRLKEEHDRIETDRIRAAEEHKHKVVDIKSGQAAKATRFQGNENPVGTAEFTKLKSRGEYDQHRAEALKLGKELIGGFREGEKIQEGQQRVYEGIATHIIQLNKTSIDLCSSLMMALSENVFCSSNHEEQRLMGKRWNLLLNGLKKEFKRLKLEIEFSRPPGQESNMRARADRVVYLGPVREGCKELEASQRMLESVDRLLEVIKKNSLLSGVSEEDRLGILGNISCAENELKKLYAALDGPDM